MKRDLLTPSPGIPPFFPVTAPPDHQNTAAIRVCQVTLMGGKEYSNGSVNPPVWSASCVNVSVQGAYLAMASNPLCESHQLDIKCSSPQRQKLPFLRFKSIILLSFLTLFLSFFYSFILYFTSWASPSFTHSIFQNVLQIPHLCWLCLNCGCSYHHVLPSFLPSAGWSHECPFVWQVRGSLPLRYYQLYWPSIYHF